MKFDDFPPLKQAILKGLLNFLHEKLEQCNRYVRDFKTVHQYALDEEATGQEVHTGVFCINAEGLDARPTGEHERRYNLSEGLKEVQVLIPDQEQSLGSRDILLRPRALNNELYNICETHRSYDPLHYPLFFPTGNEDSWNLKMKLMPRDAISVDEDRDDDDNRSQRYRSYYHECDAHGQRQLSCKDYYAYYLHERAPHIGHRDTLLRGARAFQEYICMAYAKVCVAK